MEKTVDCNTTTAPTSSSAPVPTHAPAADHLGGGGPVIVQALRAPGTGAERQRQTFWTACTSCNQKNKYPIKDLSCLLSCLHCSMKFTAVEVRRPRNKGATTTGNSQPGALIPLSCKAGAASDHASSSVLATKSVNVAPPRKKVRRGSNMTQVALRDTNIQGKLNAQKRVACMHHNNVGGRIHHKGPMQITKGDRFYMLDIMKLLQDKGKAILDGRIKEVKLEKNKSKLLSQYQHDAGPKMKEEYGRL